jgi:hypothetical protein
MAYSTFIILCFIDVLDRLSRNILPDCVAIVNQFGINHRQNRRHGPSAFGGLFEASFPFFVPCIGGFRLSDFKQTNQTYTLFTHILTLFQIIDVYFSFFVCTRNVSTYRIQKIILILSNLSEFSV